MLRASLHLGAFCLSLLTASSAAATPVAFNGHSYDLITFSGSWTGARDDAALRTYFGESGYLVTITSVAENDFLLATFDSSYDSFAWIGASDAAVEGEWRWVVGPEAGVQFSQVAVPTPPFNFANWGPVEPNNDFNEDYAGFNLGPTSAAGTAPGEWGDTKATTGLGVYLVEYDAVPEPGTAAMLSFGLLGLVGFRRRAA
jgi:hypothetical protein